jgi:calcineurin-like phosphoesterase family protein
MGTTGDTAPEQGNRALFLTSDLHFGHANIIEYTDRPFSSLEVMHDRLVGAWNDTVDYGDEVWVLGDVCMGNLSRSLRLVERLAGVKHLLAGNHDKVFRRHSDQHAAWEERYLAAGFSTISYGLTNIDLGAGITVAACHFPYRGDSHAEDRYAEQRPVDTGSFLLHGHVHGRWRQRGRMIDVGVDSWAGRPVAAATLRSLVEAGEHDLDPLEWR